MDARRAFLTIVLADSRFPSGAHAHSLGLEQAVTDGLGIEGVRTFAAARLRLVAAADARVAVAARRATSIARLVALDAEWTARCPSPVLRDAARRLGAQLLRSAAAVWDDSTIAAYRGASDATPRPIALGIVGAAAGIEDEAVALLALHDDAATVMSAALKLLPLDPAVATRWLVELAPQIADAARAAAADTRPVEEQPPPAAVGLELAAAVHHERRERLFVT
jgi:urease accessory protein